MVPPKKKRKAVGLDSPEGKQQQEPQQPNDAVMAEDDAAVAAPLPPVEIPSMAALDATLDEFLRCVDSLQPDSSSSSNAQNVIRQSSALLLTVKGVQRTLLAALEQTEAVVETVQTQVERHATSLANLNYEQGHWQAKINHLQVSAKTPQLQAMCREELGIPTAAQPDDTETGSTAMDVVDEDEDDNNDSNSTTATSRAILKQFFHGQDIYNPDHSSQQVVASLHREIHDRGNLERDCHQRAKELTNLQGILKKRTQFLHQLPDKLKEMEKASLPLQRFFASTAAAASTSNLGGSAITNDKNNASTVHLNSTDRSQRWQLAQALSGPLYTLLVQIQSYLDDFPHQKGMTLEISGTATNNKNNAANDDSDHDGLEQPHDKVVVWHLPIPNIAHEQSANAQLSSSSSPSVMTKKITITFTYFPALQVVTAKVGSGGEALFVDPSNTLLQWNEFDAGDYQVRRQPTDQQRGDDDGPETTRIQIPVATYGKPYLWCNYLAGLHLMSGQHPTEGLCGSTRAIAQDLMRHVRANAILAYLLNKVLPGKLTAATLPPHYPHHPLESASGQLQQGVKLVSFKAVVGTDDSDASTTERVYAVQLKRGSGTQVQQLKIHVRLDVARYPVVPPVWSLTGNQLQWGVKHGSYTALQNDATGNNGATTATEQQLPPLHDSRLAALEKRVNNVEGLVLNLQRQHDEYLKNNENNESNTSGEQPLNESWYYDWILSHQLREIMVEWDDWLTTNASIGEGASQQQVSRGSRNVRGRDRAKIETSD